MFASIDFYSFNKTLPSDCSSQTDLQLNEHLQSIENLSDDLAQLMADESSKDIKIQCEDKFIRAHKIILCNRSTALVTKVANVTAEGSTDNMVNIPDMEPEVFFQFIRFIYTGQVHDLTFNSAFSLYKASYQYDKELSNTCSVFLPKHLTIQNSCTMLVVANANNRKEFENKIIDYMIENRLPSVYDHWVKFLQRTLYVGL